MISKLAGNIQVVDKVSDWKDSIQTASKPLLSKGSIKEGYVNSMIDTINEHGFYVVLRDYLAMPHARPSDDVLENCVSFLKLNNPVMYGDKEVYLIFILASTSKENHLELIISLADLFQNDEIVNMLIKAKDIEEINEILDRFENINNREKES